jgi:hypothetical protein
MLTITDLDKVDDLNDEIILAIKTAKFSSDFEVFLRAQYAVFISQAVDDFSVTKGSCN